MDLDFTKFIEWGFMTILGGSISWCVKILSDISKSINQLNTQVGMILEKTAWHEKEIEKHDNRLSLLERKA